MNAIDRITDKILAADPEARDYLSRDGGIRGLLDEGAAEYGFLDMNERVARMRRLLRSVTPSDIHSAFLHVMASHGYDRGYASGVAAEGFGALLAAVDGGPAAVGGRAPRDA